MGQHFERDKDGLLQGFVIKGDAPSPAELSRIQAHLSGQSFTKPSAQPQEDIGVLSRIGRGAARSVDTAQASYYTAREGISHLFGDEEGEEEYRALADEQRRQRDTVEVPDGGHIGQRVASAAGESATMMGAGLAGAGVGAVAGSAAGPLGTLAGAALGGAGAAFPFLFNENVERQIEEHGDVKDYGKAATSAALGAVAEGVVDTATLKVGGILGRPVKGLFKEALESGVSKGMSALAKRGGGAAAVGGVSGSIEESLQQALERWQAELPLGDEQAQAEYLESAIIGGILQGGLGGVAGAAGAVIDTRQSAGIEEALKDAQTEAEEVALSASTNPLKLEKLREAEINPPVKIAGMIEDQRRQTDLPAGLLDPEDGFVSETDKSSPDFSEEDYRAAVEAVRGEKSVAPDKIKSLMKIGRPKANALFRAMLDRKDASPTGSASQYLKILSKPDREFEVAPINPEQQTPFNIYIKGKKRASGFQTQEQATEWASSIGAEDFEIRHEPRGGRFGLYEVQYQTDPTTKQRTPIGRRTVEAFASPKEAQDAARNLDPNYGIESNLATQKLVEERQRSLLKEQVAKELGPVSETLQKHADAIIGQGRARVQVVPRVTPEYLNSIGVPNEAIPSGNVVVEGVTVPDIQSPVSQVIALSNDLYSPELSQEQRTQKLNEVLTHELVHAMRNLDLLKPKEWDSLFHHALTQRVPGKKYTHMQLAAARVPKSTPQNLVPEEGIAEMLRLYMRDPTYLEKPQRSLVQKLVDFIRKLLNLGKNNDATDVIKAIFGGEMVSRETGSGGLGPRYPGKPFFSTVQVPGFYMKSDKVFSEFRQEKASADQWMGMVKNAGIREEELKWLGLEEWMKAQPRVPINRGDVLDFIRSNAVEIHEERLGGTTELQRAQYNALEDSERNLDTMLYQQFIENRDNVLPEDVDPSAVATAEEYHEWIKEEAHRFDNDLAIEFLDVQEKMRAMPADQASEPLYPSTTQPGGDEYTEFVFTLPQINPPYNPPHFARPNLLAHARFKTRYFDDGLKTLFIEEIQSDWHQQGKKSGYVPRGVMAKIGPMYDEITKLGERQDAIGIELRLLRANINRAPPGVSAEPLVDQYRAKLVERDEIGTRMNELLDLIGELRGGNNAVPDAPLKTTWDEFVFKRLVRYAAENEFDQIAWHGEPDSVAHTEGYHTMVKREGPDGKVEYVQDHGEEIPATNVTGIINFYLKRVRDFASKYFKKFNSGVRFEAAEKPELNIYEVFQNLDDYVSFVSNATWGPVHPYKFSKAYHIMVNQREFNPKLALQQAGVQDRDLISVLSASGFLPEAPASVDNNGNPTYDKWVMPMSAELKAASVKEGFPIFSATEARHRGHDVMGDPKFQRWFKNSVVTEEDGIPKIMYHGTKWKKPKTEFRRMAHFGTADAAEDRLRAGDREASGIAIGERLGIPYNKVSSWWKNLDQEERDELVKEQWAIIEAEREGARIYPAFLSVQNPLEIIDDQVDHTTADYAKAAAYAKAISWDEAKQIMDSESLDDLIQMLEGRGYDGFVYRNRAEDYGSLSYVVFSPTQIKSVFNQGTWSPFDPRISYSAVETPPLFAATAPVGQRVQPKTPVDKLRQVEQTITYNNLAPAFQRLSRVLGQGTTAASYRRGVESTIINFQDRMQPIGKLIDHMKKNDGFVSTENDPYLRETLFSGQTDAQLTENDVKLYKPLITAVTKLSVTKEDADRAKKINDASLSIIDSYRSPKQGLAELYVYAQHAQERNAVMRKRNEDVVGQRPDQFEHGSGISNIEAQEILNWFNNQRFAKEFSDASNPNSIRTLVRKIITNTNDIRVAAGLNPDFRTWMKEDGTPVDPYLDYVPLRSFISEHTDQDDDALAFAKAGKGFSIMGKEDFSALGRRSLASNIIEHAILQNEEAIVRAGKNKVGQSFLQLIRENPQLMKDVAEILPAKRSKWVLDRSTGKVRRAADNSATNDPSVLKVKENGDQVFIKIKDPRIAQAMGSRSSLGNAGAGAFMKALLNLNRFLAATRTSYNPEFMVSNMLRDLEAALVNLTEVDKKGVRTKVAASVFPALNGVRHAVRTGKYDTEWSKTFQEFRKMGGMTAFYGIRQLDDTINKVNAALSEDMAGAPHKVWNAIKAVGGLVEDYNLAIENGTRLSAYKTLRDHYLSLTDDPTLPDNIRRAKERAAFAAKNLTVNFNMGGEIKPVMNALYLFYNAGLQGSMALLNPFIRSRKMKAIWAAVLTAGLLQDQIMNMIGPEDDDGQKLYDKIPQHVLEHNIVMMDPFGLSDRGYWKLPLPYLMNGIYNAGRALSRGMRGGYTPGEATNSILGTVAESLNPWGGANSFLNFVAPTVLDPFVELSINENFADEPIAPPENPFGLSEKASQRYWNNTSPAAVVVADWVSRLTGSTGDYIPGTVEMSPNQVEHVYEWMAGGTGTFVQRAVDLVAGKNVVENMITGGEWSANDLPFVRRAYGNVTTKNDLQSYIGERDKVLRIRNELRQAQKNGDSQHYADIIQRYPDEYRVSATINKIENARKKISGQIKKIRDSKRLPEQRKVELVKELKKKQDQLVGRANGIMAGLR